MWKEEAAEKAKFHYIYRYPEPIVEVQPEPPPEKDFWDAGIAEEQPVPELTPSPPRETQKREGCPVVSWSLEVDGETVAEAAKDNEASFCGGVCSTSCGVGEQPNANDNELLIFSVVISVAGVVEGAVRLRAASSRRT